MKYHFFCSRGGSGSSALNTLIPKSGYGTFHASKPDVSFVPKQYVSKDPTLPEYQDRQVIGDKGYQEYPDESACTTFFKRSDYTLNPLQTIDENLFKYTTYVEQNHQTVLFNMAPIMNFFSRHSIPNVVFLVRHPLYAYISWTKPQRHLSVVEPFGGINSTGGVTLFTGLWGGLVKEYLLLKEKGLSPALIRYEHAQEDAESIDPDLSDVFSSWHGGSSTRDALTPETEALLKTQVEDVFFQLYETW